jgi:acylphosphatase
MKPQKARRFLVSGRVQGVGYRAFAQHAARRIGVTGWARNLADGGVEVHANGTESQLNDFEALLRRGPSWSDVRSVDVTEAAMADIAGFQIC